MTGKKNKTTDRSVFAVEVIKQCAALMEKHWNEKCQGPECTTES